MIKKVWTYDLETLHNFFCAVFKAKDEEDYRVFEISPYKNDYELLWTFLRNEVKALRGFNNLDFDAQVIQFIYNNEKSAEEIFEFVQTHLIEQEKKPYRVKDFYIFNLDIYKILHLDNKNRRVG